MTVFWAYFDETGHPNDPNVAAFGIAGLRATCSQWVQFNDEWNKALATEGIDTFHMRQFYSRDHEPYNGWSADKKGAFLMSLVDLIEAVKPPIGAMKKFSDDPADRETIQEEWRESYHGCIRSGVQTVPESAKVHFVFASHPEVSPALLEPYHGWLIEGYRQVLNDARVGTFSFADPKDLPPLQAADFIAWELARNARYPNPVRPTLRRLLDMRARIYVR